MANTETRTFGKLVRDKIPEVIKRNSKDKKITIKTYKVKGLEFIKFLKLKLEEEIDEFFDNPSVEEMADIFEVLFHLAEVFNIDLNEVEKKRKEKLEERGGFKEKIVLDYISEETP